MRQEIAAYKLFKGGCSFYYNYRGIISGLSNERMSPAFFTIPLPSTSSIFFVTMSRMKNIKAFSTSPSYSGKQTSQQFLQSEPPIEETIIAKEQQQEVSEYINRLPSFLREVIYLHYYKNLSIKQIARLINKPSPIVKTWLNHSIYWLKIFVLKFKPPE